VSDAAALGLLLEDARALRARFDAGFAEPIAAAISELDVIAVYAGGSPCAFAQHTIAGLCTDLHVVALPTSAPALLGAASFRGNVVAVWDLGLLVHGAPTTAVRWCAILADQIHAVAFDRLDGRVRVPAPVGRVIEHAHTLFPVIDLSAAVAGARAGVKGASDAW
jgi:purine-binding chemotaxis protein CheW